MQRKPMAVDAVLRAYVVGLALGDGNLSNPNGRCTRLRITCDLKYPFLVDKIQAALQRLFPKSVVSIVSTPQRAVNVSCYSNSLELLLGWSARGGSKLNQGVRIPSWVYTNREYEIACLRGLIETDGSVYTDRGYQMVMFVSVIEGLARDCFRLFQDLGFLPRFYTLKNLHSTYGYDYKRLYHVRLAKDTARFLALVQPDKR